MEAVELDHALEELETRVERLRALYEQYFMGIEKIPPHIVQKDVDRRLYLLRREQIRNTARRFKLQTIVQRYNTFQQYWMRIMREIENGTYRRHVLRAERTVGIANLLTAAERKRLGLPEAHESESPPDDGDMQSEALDGKSSSEQMRAKNSDSTSELSAPALSPAAIRSQIERDLGLLLSDQADELSSLGGFDLGRELDDPLLSSLPPPPKERAPAPSRIGPRPAEIARNAPEEPRLPPSVGTQQAATLPTNFLRTSVVEGAAAGVESATAKAPQGLRLPAHSAIGGRGLPPPRSAVGGRGLPPPQSAVAGRGLPPPPRPSGERPPPAPRENPDERIAAAPAAASSKEPPHVAGTPASVQRSPTPTPPASIPPSRPRGLPDVRDSVIPSSIRPPGTPRAVAPTREHGSASTTKRDKGTLDPSKIQTLAHKLEALRVQTNESKSVSVSALTRKLEVTSAELRQKHPGKQIDFDVVIKDGKAIVKPIVR